MYESPTSQGLAPDLYVDAGELVEAKAGLVRAHVSQVLKNGLVDFEIVEALARDRGFQARLRHAEAYEADRFVWDPGPAPSAVIPSDLSELSLITEGAA
jgi:LmbE family N-acetylglucosaminyl deacetylase